LLKTEHYDVLIGQMTSLNAVGEALGKMDSIHAMTDVTGFGILGHLIEMAEGSGLSAELYYSAIQKIAGLEDYLKQRTIPDATFRNWNSYSTKVHFENGVDVMEAFNLLPDPQTNGGLLIAAESAEALTAVFADHHLSQYLTPIGRIKAKDEKTVYVSNQ
jgi:selenide,water dikinase